MGEPDLETKEAKWPAPYKELTQMMYALRRLCPSLALLGASAVHPRHPLSSDHIELMAAFAKDATGRVVKSSEKSSGRFGVPSLFLVVKKCIWCLLFALHDSLVVLYLKLRFGILARKIKREPVAMVMKTWCFGPESMKSADDFYYGKLPGMLRERGLSCLLLCGDATGGSYKAFSQEVLKRTHVRSMPEWMLMPLWAPLVVAWKQMVTGLVLRRLAQETTDPRFAMLCAYACLDCLGHSAMRNTLYFYIAKIAVKTWNPSVFITLYEGHPWEMLVWHGVKAASKKTVTVGYQHTVIMPHSLSLTWPNHGSWEISAPDVVLCLGTTTKNMMKSGHEPHKTRIVRFGSFRRDSINFSQHPPKAERHTVLVVPEGMIPEAKVLFNFATQVACLLPDHHFIFRCHPMLPFDQVYPHLDRKPMEVFNIEVSDHPIDYDLARSSVVLYRGSSAVLYAVLKGLKPIYLHDDRYPDVDPLFELIYWRECVSSVSEIKHLLRRYAATSDRSTTRDWREVFTYINDYTMPVDDASIDRFLEAVGLFRGTAVG
jgi:hypothetical protein